MVSAIVEIVIICALGPVVIYGLAHLWAYLQSAETNQDRTDFTVTDDGWRIAIHNYAPRVSKVGKPVILCHGVAGNRFIFDLEYAPSLAEFLRSQGRDVWVAELRGSGNSRRPGLLLSECPLNWGFDDHLNYDVEAIIRHVTQETGSESVHWIGHSMGGMLIEAYLARNQSACVASAVALGSPTDFSGMWSHAFKHVLEMKWILRALPFNPFIPLLKCFLPLARLAPGVLSIFFCPENIEWQTARKISAIGTELISSSVLWLDISRFLVGGKFADPLGRPYLKGFDASRTPLLAICGTKDLMAPQEATLHVCESSADNCVRDSVVLGKLTGCLHDYGHLDLLLGCRAREEVFPVIESWLARWDSSTRHECNATVN